ncbi:MAG TPA: hypothetical protein VG123_32625, partial [Streptosporangiaceae bacterium]|nr:hypothetical protein [Streptosporangiaceae bacterium]
MGGRTILVALACGRSAIRGSWRQALALALLIGLLGGVALGAVAGARRTATAYGRYLAAINASDVFVNVPGQLPGMPATRPYELISALPGVVAHAAYIGLSGQPLVHGKPDNSFLVNSLNGSLDGEYFSQDRATVLAGRLPPQGSTSTVVLTPAIAKAFGTGVGGMVRYQFRPVDAQQQPAGKPFTRSFRVAAIVEVPPALTDESDQAEGSIFPPGVTRQLLPEYFYAWIGLRLAQGTAGTGALEVHLATLAADLLIIWARSLSHQHQHGQRRDRAEHAQRDRLRPDRLLHLATDDVGAVDRERGRGHVAVQHLPGLPLQIRGQGGQVLLQRTGPGRALGQPQPDPRVEVLRQQLPGRPRREDAPLRLVGLVDQGGRNLHDRRHPEGPGERLARRLLLRAHRRELIADRAADAGPERLRHAGREHHRPGRSLRRQPACQHGGPVLAEVLAVEAPVQAVDQEGLVGLSTHQRHSAQA